MAANSINKDLMLLSAIETRWKCWKGVKIVVNANCGVFESCKLKKNLHIFYYLLNLDDENSAILIKMW